jgi:2-octaprenyl-6-methoxyphenol hydroxylase
MRFDFAALSAAERYKLMVATIVPRPIAWVVTRDAAGSLNAAPYSLFNMVSDDPPVLAFSAGPSPATGTRKDYGASAIVCTVRTSRPHAHVAYERFTPEGPIALLPLHDRYALVWTTPAEQVAMRLALDDAAFLTALQAAFGERQGRFLAAGPRAAFPLRLLSSAPPLRPGLVRVGNAAQTLHPVAGQGFNLGLRDVWKLAEAVTETTRADLGSAEFIAGYLARRRWDVGGGIAMTDLLVELFANDRPLLRQARGASLVLLDALAPVKRLFARKMMFGAQAW